MTEDRVTFTARFNEHGPHIMVQKEGVLVDRLVVRDYHTARDWSELLTKAYRQGYKDAINDAAKLGTGRIYEEYAPDSF